MLTHGTRLGPYEIVAPIGSGGMGEVYRARDSRLERDVAVKVLARALKDQPEALARFEREAKAVAALSHPNILAIHDIGCDGPLPFSVTELLEGRTLRERLDQGPLSWREAAEVGVAVAEGLAAAHAKGIVHRDLKPDNLFLTADGRVKILDFGLARSVPPGAAAHDPNSTPTLLRDADEGLVVGTLGYMSPEQARGQTVGPPSDLFSMGCVLYEAVSGRRPFDRPTPTDTLAAILHEVPQPVAQSGRHVPAELARVIDHCLQKAPEARFQSASDLAFALRAVLGDSGVDLSPAPKRRGVRRRVRSLAVLPFDNEGGDPSADFLSEGITEGLINRLSRIGRLRVVPRATAFRFRGRGLDPEAAGAELNVDAVLTGRVTQRGETLGVQAELVDTSTASQLWGQRYVRERCDCAELEDAIADEIATALAPRLGAGRGSRGAATREKPAAARPAPVNAEAYQDYLRGRHFFHKWTPEGFGKAVEFFQKAIETDPAYAPAYAGLADAYGAAAFYGFIPPQEAMPRVEFAASRALALDSRLAEAHASLGLCAMFHRWDWAAAEREFTRSIELNPRLASTRVYYSLFLTARGRPDESVAQARQAEELEPFSVLAVMSVAWALMLSRQLEAGLAQLYRVLALDPGFPDALAMMARIAEHQGRFPEAAERMRAWLVAVELPGEGADLMAEGFRREGATGYWRAMADVLGREAAASHHFGYALACVYSILGERDKALAQLERCYDTYPGALVFLRIDPTFDPLRSDPRFEGLLERMHLAD